jgi:hypothetical protein
MIPFSLRRSNEPSRRRKPDREECSGTAGLVCFVSLELDESG